ncbi:FAD-binding oxidoreductase [Amycolatopsis sp. cmx-4-83]|uniref:FAD-binding oxidoreductase n=1 Tax=Amycolatopsis sp. cmx-4-83 TaxID=2790940 RepID=UPI00397AD3DC
MRWNALERRLAGELLTPASAGYDEARRSEMARYDSVRPAVVVRCTTDADVAVVLAAARETGLPLAIRGGGHDFAGHSSTAGILLDTRPMATASVEGGRLVVGAGARLADAYDALAPHGRTIPAGCGPTVGLAGHALAGGMGILGRRHGFAADRLRAATVVLADGRVVACSEQREPDLFWALRGAGTGNFGVVTRLVFDPVPAPEATSFHLTWGREHAPALVLAWQEWLAGAPREVAPSLMVTASANPADEPVTHLFGTLTGGAESVTEFVRSLPAPFTDTRVTLPYRETKAYLAENGPGDDHPGAHLYSRAEFIGTPLPADVVEALLAEFDDGRKAGEGRSLELLPSGGAYNDVDPAATAFPHRDAQYLLKHAADIDADLEPADTRKWLNRSWDLTRPWGTGGAYPGFPDPDLEDAPSAYYGANLARLRAVKAHYDPDGLFRFAQSVPLA